MDIAEFIEARAAEREAAAKDAPGEFDTTWLDVDWFREGMGAADYYGSAPPGRTLREVAATRCVLARHRDTGSKHFTGDPPMCDGCPNCIGHEGEPGICGLPAIALTDCPELRDLAAIDAGHPDYDPSWAPEQVSA